MNKENMTQETIKNQAVTKVADTSVATFNDNDFDQAGSDQDLGKNDILIPKVLIMQGQSPKVLEGEAMFGEVRDSLNWEVLGKAKQGDKPAKVLTCIPFHRERLWVIKKAVGDKWMTETIITIDKTNDQADQYETWIGDDGAERKRVLLLCFYVLIPGKVIPYVIGFRGSSLEAGKALSTQMYVSNKRLQVKEAFKRSPMGTVVDLTPKKVSKNDNTYTIFEMSVNRPSTLEEASEALKWQRSVSAGETKADHGDVINEDKPNKNTEF